MNPNLVARPEAPVIPNPTEQTRLERIGHALGRFLPESLRPQQPQFPTEAMSQYLQDLRPDTDPQLADDAAFLMEAMYKVTYFPVVRPGETKQEYKVSLFLPWRKLAFDDQLRFKGVQRRTAQRRTIAVNRALEARAGS